MKKEAFFGFLGRANAVILFLCGLGILGLMGYGIYQELGDRYNSRGPCGTRGGLRPVAGQIANPDSLLSLGKFEASEGTSWVYAEFTQDRQDPWEKEGCTRPVTANYLFLDIDSGETRWLKPTHTGSVDIMVEEFGYRFDWGEIQASFHLYRVREKDTNGDGEVDRLDEWSLAISALDGSGYRILVERYGYSRFLERNSAGNFVIFHQREETLWMTEIDSATLQLVKDEKVDVRPAFNGRD